MRTLSFAAATTLIAGVLVTTSSGTAQAGCSSQWWPSDGALQVASTRGSLEDDHVDVAVTFRFSAADLAALSCTGDSALEVEGILDGVVAGSGTVSGASNLPSYYLDTEFSDDPEYRNLAIGTARVDELRADTEYVVQLNVRNPEFDGTRVTAYLNFQRGHWARWWNPKEVAACTRGLGADDWCVNASETAVMQHHGVPGLTIAHDDNSATLATQTW